MQQAFSAWSIWFNNLQYHHKTVPCASIGTVILCLNVCINGSKVSNLLLFCVSMVCNFIAGATCINHIVMKINHWPQEVRKRPTYITAGSWNMDQEVT